MLGDTNGVHARHTSAAFLLDAMHSYMVGIPEAWISLMLCMLSAHTLTVIALLL